MAAGDRSTHGVPFMNLVRRGDSITGALFGLASAVLFGVSTPFAKLVLGADVDPWLLAGLLYLGSGLGLLLFRMVRKLRGQASNEAPLRRADLPWLFGAIASGGVIAPILLMVGLLTTQASSAALLLNLEGVATVVIAWTAFREHFDRRIFIGAVTILAGATLLSWQTNTFGGISVGALAIAGACLGWGIDNNITRKISATDPVQIAMLKGLVAGGVNLTLALLLGAKLPAIEVSFAAGAIGLLGYGVSLVFFVMALRHVGTARTGAYFSAAPFVGALVGIVLFSEPITAWLLVATALMAFGLYLHLVERHQHEHVHDELEHEHAHVHDEHHQHVHASDDPSGEPHSHRHRHARLIHSHPHFPDLHHQHSH